MIYSSFKDKKLSLLGFGTMRLPTAANGEIDRKTFQQMVDLSIKNGINYFDTAWPYHSGLSETELGLALSKYTRDSYYIATKYPGHQVSRSYDPAAVFEKQLQKCGVDYFDFYLLHNVYENSLDVYMDEKWSIFEYFKEQKRLGLIRHLGFSTHATTETMKKILDIMGEDMEFCQIQLNWVDYTLQDGIGKIKLLNERNIPIWVMEPVRGGKLCTLSAENEAKLKDMRPDESIPAWGFRFLQDIPGVTMILSGMSNTEQMMDNLNTFEELIPLSETERNTLLGIAEELKDSIPCTACRYCTDTCPMGLDIPLLIANYNELRFVPSVNTSMRLDALPENKLPSACIGCGACTQICPQKINIPDVMKAFTEKLTTITKWSDVCAARERDQK
ncbi:MAG: aldo/keto reductase [Clostridia bacterium]|nr:aldo/keto reductase [Clostridia bacterium]